MRRVRKFKADRSEGKKKIVSRIEENEKILNSKIDKFMTLFKGTDIDFYTDYFHARSLKPDKKRLPVVKPALLEKSPGPLNPFPGKNRLGQKAFLNQKKDPVSLF